MTLPLLADYFLQTGCLIWKPFNVRLTGSFSAENLLKENKWRKLEMRLPGSEMSEGNVMLWVCNDDGGGGFPGPSLSARNVPSSTPAHCRSPSERGESPFRLLFILGNMKRAGQRTGLAANELTVGGWWLAHVCAAPGSRGEGTGGRTTEGTQSCCSGVHLRLKRHLEATEKTPKSGAERLNWACRGRFSAAIKCNQKINKWNCFLFWSELRHFGLYTGCLFKV